MKRFIAAISALAVSIGCYADNTWRTLELDNTILMTLPQGKVVIELAPQFTPKHVDKFKKLAKQGFYDGVKFYRVIDGFVAQAGPADGSEKDKSVPNIAMEGEWTTNEKFSYTQVQSPDLFAEITGFKDGFALAHNPKEKSAWLTHCPGVIAMARGNEPDTGSSHFYIVNGQAPRYLDRIMSIFGRVVYGMNHIQSLQRTAVIEGDTPVDKKDHSPIISMQLMADVKPEDRILIEVENTESEKYLEKIIDRKKREAAFFYKKPPPVLDICQTPVKSRVVKSSS